MPIDRLDWLAGKYAASLRGTKWHWHLLHLSGMRAVITGFFHKVKKGKEEKAQLDLVFQKRVMVWDMGAKFIPWTDFKTKVHVLVQRTRETLPKET